MANNQPITLRRDCAAVQVPHGNPVTLRAGTPVTVIQELGGTFTLQTEFGFLVRLEGLDADALGYEVPVSGQASVEAGTGEGVVSESAVWEQLRTCYDPEIPVNIVELGLIYECKVSPLEAGGSRVEVKMTLTAPGCGMGQVIAQDVEHKIARLPGAKEVAVELVFYPPWDPSMMTEAARLQLGLFY